MKLKNSLKQMTIFKKRMKKKAGKPQGVIN